ncbi:MAG: hypothetical protein A2W31_01655, partial [Planctomycetes bacterium RBG_16_64_10]
MTVWDYAALVGYFLTMLGIGWWARRRTHTQEDYFMGGRSFGAFVQTFAALGIGTGSSGPVTTAHTTLLSGMSGLWGIVSWLFVTPCYWITGVWYRRMRHLTLGDWFVERYESPALGAAYALFGLLFFMVFGSMMFSTVGRVAAPLVGTGTVSVAGQQFGIEYVLVPVTGAVVIGYVVLGGLRAVYWTDVAQGFGILLLSILLIPLGLRALVGQFGDPQTQGLGDGFRILHEQLPATHFALTGTASSAEHPLYLVAALVLVNLVGVVIQPHFITLGGGSAKTETGARTGLVVGSILKRLCALGWTMTALIGLALYADRSELATDPDQIWGLASRELLGPGLTGLMLACLLGALMSSVDTYMLVGSALVVRNVYAPYVNPKATEQQYVALGRLTGAIVVVGSVVISLCMMDVFKQLQLTWVVAMLFAAPFWVGIFWRRATTAAAWSTVACSALLFFVIPWLTPRLWPDLRTYRSLTVANDVLVTTTRRVAAPSDIKRRQAAMELWEATYQQLVEADQNVGQAFGVPAGGWAVRGRAAADPTAGLEQTLPPADRLAEQSAALQRLAH